MRIGGRTDIGVGLIDCTIPRLPPAFLISQKSKIFDSFPPGEAFGRCRASAVNYNLLSYILSNKPSGCNGALTFFVGFVIFKVQIQKEASIWSGIYL